MSSHRSDQTAELVNAARLATLGTLMAGIAHELNTPMGALVSNHDTVKRALRKLATILDDEVVTADELDEVRRVIRALDGILKVNDLAVGRVTELISGLRSFGRPDRAEVDRVDIHENIDTALTLLRHETRDRIDVHRDYADLPPVECYPHQLSQVFMNLLLNAVQAIRERGAITVRTRAADHAVLVEVEDTGVGIEPGSVSQIFEPGFTTKGARVGMGLGLLIVRQVVDRHGGDISVRSVPGTGTTFTVRLPVRLATPARPADLSRMEV